MKNYVARILIIAIVSILLFSTQQVRADVISDWNAIAVQTTVTGARPGPSGVIDIAIVHAAMYDAVQAIETRYEPYYAEIPGATGSPVAAAARAARDVLINRFPSQSSALETAYQQYLATHNIPDSDPGLAVGAAAAATMISLRACDGAFPTGPQVPFIGGTEIGMWRPTPPANLPMAAPWLGHVMPFFMTRPSQFRAAPPPDFRSRQYVRDYNEVKNVGELNSNSRTPQQTDVAHFYAGNTVVIWNRGLRDISNARVGNVADSSRLFALATMAIADGLITSWNDKTHYVYWRPITAIREGHADTNPATTGDPTWNSLITTPNYPDYTSGAVNFATAATKMLEHFFDTDNIAYSLTTTNTGPTVEDTRTYNRLSDATQDVVDARVYSGIHFRFADEAAFKQAKEIAFFGFRNYLRPVNHGGGGSEPSASTGRKREPSLEIVRRYVGGSGGPSALSSIASDRMHRRMSSPR